MNLISLSVKNNKIETILELKPILRYLQKYQYDVSKSLEKKLNQKMGKDIKSDFFPPYFNVYYVFDNNRGKNLDKLRMIIYLFLEKNNFPKNISLSNIPLSFHDRLLFHDYHFNQIKKELSRRGISFNFYKNYLSSSQNPPIHLPFPDLHLPQNTLYHLFYNNPLICHIGYSNLPNIL